MEAVHEMELIRVDEKLLEWLCPECGRHCFVHLRESPVRLEIREKGDQFVRHSGSNLLSVDALSVGAVKRH